MTEQHGVSVDLQHEEQWTVGLYYSFTSIQFEVVNNEDKARRIYDNSTSSKVLLYQDKDLITCSTAWWDTEGIGVATLLQGPKTSKTIDEIRTDLEEGRLPRVPPTRHMSTQISLKMAMKMIFGRKACTHFGSAPYRHQSLCYYDVKKHPRVQKHVALTIDDAPCRFGADGSELPRIRNILKEFDAKATFMIIGSWCTPDHREDLINLLRDGHEMGNHGMMDCSYQHDHRDKFGAAVDECSEIIADLQTAAGLDNVGVRWFRAPHGRYTKEMAEELDSRNLVNVMCDTYASCPVIQDGEFIGRHLTSTCQDGSIILLHMPEKPVRQWCWTALVGLLQGLKERDFEVVTVGELSRLAEKPNAEGS
jgi:peptidoglycan/xylan/chitin deacetylase (PgdA/CDA1 family)